MNTENTDLETEDTATESEQTYFEKTFEIFFFLILFVIGVSWLGGAFASDVIEANREHYVDGLYQLEEIGLPEHGILGEASDVPTFYSESPNLRDWTTNVRGWSKSPNTYTVSVTIVEEYDAFVALFKANQTTRTFFQFDVSSGTPELEWRHAIESSEHEYSLASLGWMSEDQLRSIPFSKNMNPLEMDRIQTVIEQRLWGVGVEQESELDN
jgi:hypothetical protein